MGEDIQILTNLVNIIVSSCFSILNIYKIFLVYL